MSTVQELLNPPALFTRRQQLSELLAGSFALRLKAEMRMLTQLDLAFAS
jgi:hypothetical protein